MTAITCAGCKHSYGETALFCPNCGRPKVREGKPDALVGKLLGERFQVQELLGQGGSGTIYRAEHVTLRRRVAIKVLHTELSRDDLAVERFRREATTVADIDNEHIVEIHDFGRTPDGRLYMAMELLEGETLDAVIARDKQLSVERTADILSQVGEALMEAHAIGYVHRDLRPRNMYLTTRRGKANFVKLLDFGLAKLVEVEGQAASTSLGMTFGDPRYMSPEQARGDRIDRRADIYQLGCVAYEMLTGTPPFGGSRVFDILTRQVTETPAPLPDRRAGIPLWMESAVAKMLAKSPDDRFATTTRMVEALRRGLETGEVMDDEIARRRESVPPPSVSRVMQRMGITTPGELPRVDPAPLPVAEPRKRTGTPQVGTPVVQPPVMGEITQRPARAVEENVSQVWYDDDEAATKRAPSASDSLYDDEELPKRRRWPLLAAVLGGIVMIGVVVFAATRSNDRKKPAAVDEAAATVPGDGGVAVAVATPGATIDAAAAVPAPPAVPDKRPNTAARQPYAGGSYERVPPTGSRTRPVVDDLGLPPIIDDPASRRPGGNHDPVPVIDDPAARRPGGNHDPVVVQPPREPVKVGVSGVDGPQDPYNPAPVAPPVVEGSPEKKAEFYASLGTQQLGQGDTSNAAASFKKALELDPRNVAATTGMGETALRLGQFGDAISFLSRSARLAPRNSMVFTLLGEAYLGSGNSGQAQSAFKRALQLDSDNKRARDGFNEASSRVPPPSDD